MCRLTSRLVLNAWYIPIARSDTQQAEVSHVHTHTHYGQVSHWAWESSKNGIGYSIHMWQDLIHR